VAAQHPTGTPGTVQGPTGGQHPRGRGLDGTDRDWRGMGTEGDKVGWDGMGWDGTQQPPPLEASGVVGTAAGPLAEALLGEPPALLRLCLQGSQHHAVQLQGGQGGQWGTSPVSRDAVAPEERWGPPGTHG